MIKNQPAKRDRKGSADSEWKSSCKGNVCGEHRLSSHSEPTHPLPPGHSDSAIRMFTPPSAQEKPSSTELNCGGELVPITYQGRTFDINCVSGSHSVTSDFLWPHGLQPTSLPCPWDSPGKNTGVGCHFLLQGIFLTQGLNLDLPHCVKPMIFSIRSLVYLA